MKMTWEHKLAALQAIADTSLRMRKPGDWYVEASGRSIGGDGMLAGAFGNGSTPRTAVEDDWQQMTNLPDNKYIVIESGDDRRHVVWNGFMWRELPKLSKPT